MKKISEILIKVSESLLRELKEHWLWIVVVVILLLVFGYYVRWKLNKPPVYIKVPEIKEVIKYKIKKVEVPIESGKVVVLEKKEVIKHIKGLPEEFVSDPKKQVTSTGDIKPSEAGTDVLNIIDTQTGVSEIFAKERQLPFIGFESKSEVGMRAGVTGDGKEIDIYAKHDVLRIGKFHVGGYVEGAYCPDADTVTNWKAMAVISRRW